MLQGHRVVRHSRLNRLGDHVDVPTAVAVFTDPAGDPPRESRRPRIGSPESRASSRWASGAGA